MESKPKRKYDPRWPDRTRTQRSASRVDKLNAIAQAAGFDSWRRLETAVLNGKAKIVNLPPDPR